MRDRRNCSDYASSTGPDRYFDESLQYPTFGKHSSSSSSYSFFIDRKSILIPSSFPSTEQQQHQQQRHPIRFPGIARPSLVVAEQHDFRHPIVSKNFRECPPTDSPGSSKTLQTSPSTDSDSDHENDLDSCCGSLTYSVESFAIGQQGHFEDIDEGYHAEDEHTTGEFGRSCSSLYDDHDLDDDDDNSECFVGHPCAFVFDGILDWFQATLKVVSQQISGEGGNLEPRERRRLYYPSDHRY